MTLITIVAKSQGQIVQAREAPVVYKIAGTAVGAGQVD